MSTIIRGVKNAFRNTIRTFSVVIILALSIGLALIMLLSYQTVNTKITSVKSDIGNTISVSPAGFQGGQGGGEPLTTSQMTSISSLPNVANVAQSLNERLTNGTDTNLQSSITPGTLGSRFGGGNGPSAGFGGAPDSGTATRTFTLPVMLTGLSDTSLITNSPSKITSGSVFAGSSTSNVAVIGTDLASKNNLSVGSTFTAYGNTVSVVGIFDAGNTFGNSGLYMPIIAVQTLSGQTGQVTAATVTINDISNVDSAVTAIQNKLGSTVADVVSNQQSAQNTITPLENIKTISLYSLIGSLVAGVVITLLIMIMIVRERRREIGVLKAIGSSNIAVVTQFVSEALVLTLFGGVIGVIAGTFLSNPILNILVTNSATANSSGPMGAGGRGFARVAGNFGGGIRSAVSTLHANVGTDIILYGLLVAIAVAIIGSAIPAFLIAKVKPAEAMRAE